MLEKQINYKGLPLYYTVSGDGPVVLLLHGFGEDGSVWKKQLNALPGYKVIVPSLPGTGKSATTEDMSMEGLAASIREIIKAEETTSFVMLGHSMGGYVTLAYAAVYPADLVGFGLIHSTAFGDTEERKETRKKGVLFIEKNGGAAFLKTSVPSLYSSYTKTNSPDVVEAHLKLTTQFTDAALTSYYRSMIQRPDRTETLKEAVVPVLFVAGRWDEAIPLQDVLRQTSLPGVSYIHILENSGHMGMTEEPEKMNKAIKEFTNYCFKHRIK